MLKAGIFVDAENVMRNGGWRMRYQVLKQWLGAQGAEVVRGSAYIAIDEKREAAEPAYHRRKADYREALRAAGFKLILKSVKRYYNEDGEEVLKANADIDLAIDVLQQATRLEYILLLTGDGDFTRLVLSLQALGCRVDVIGFHNVSRELRESADNYHSGFVIPGLVQWEEGRYRGHLSRVDEGGYFGFITVLNSPSPGDSKDVFLHGKQLEGGRYGNEEFANLRGTGRVIEFSLEHGERGLRAANAVVLRPVQKNSAALAAANESQI